MKRLSRLIPRTVAVRIAVAFLLIAFLVLWRPCQPAGAAESADTRLDIILCSYDSALNFLPAARMQESPNKTAVDERIIKKFNTPDKQISEDAVGLSPPPSKLREYRSKIYQSIAVIATLALLVVALVTIIITRRAAVKALRESENRFRAAFGATRDSIYIWDTGHICRYANQAALAETAINPDHPPPLVGQPLDKALAHRPWRMRLWAERIDTAMAGRRNLRMEERWEDQGHIRYVDTCYSPVAQDDGKITSVCMVCRDMTDQKRMEGHLREAHKMEAIGTLAGGIAHDFNNMLSIIMGNTELALDDVPENNAARSNLEEIRTAGLRAKQMVRQLLIFSRRSSEMRRPLRLGSLIQESIPLLAASLPDHIKIQSRVHDDGIRVTADPDLIRQLLVHICDNAVYAMEAQGGTLEIILAPILNPAEGSIAEGAKDDETMTENERWLSLSFQDEGCGIPEFIIGRIFDPYFTTKDFGKGDGMGLAIAHGIVKSHQGEISVENAPGKGALVRILFPAYHESTDAAEAKNLMGSGKRILVVDDETPVVKMLSAHLNHFEYEVETFRHPDEALAEFRNHPEKYDLLITDQIMPLMSGTMLATEIRSIRPDLPIIFCTGFPDQIDPDKASALRVQAVLIKPIDRTDLARTVRHALHQTSIAA